MVVPIKLIENHDMRSNYKVMSHYHQNSTSKVNGGNNFNDSNDLEEALESRDHNDSNNPTSLDVADGNTHSIQVLPVNDNIINEGRQTKDNGNDFRFYQNDSTRLPNCILLPHSDVRSYWDLYISILLIYVGAFVPYRVSFLGDLDGIMEGVEVFVDISFFIDIILNFMTGYETREGQFEIRFKEIARHYFKTYFLLDLIATVPIDRLIELIFANETSVNGLNNLTKLPRLIKIVRLTKLLKILRLYRFKKWIRDVQLNYSIHHGITRLMNIVLIVLFATHLVACIWHGLGVRLDLDDGGICEGGIEDGWVCREKMSDETKGYKYTAALYWSFSTLTTVGYGDIAGRTIEEQIFSMLMMLLGVSWYAYTVGSMSTILSSFDKQNKQVRERMIQVNAFIRETKLPSQLGSRIRRYFEYSLARKQNGLYGYDADLILQEMSSTLRTDVLCFVEAKLIASIPFFEGKSRTFIANTIQALRPIIIQKGDYIIKEGSAADEMYFLIRGTATVYYGDSEVNKLHEGAYFGEIGCILGGVRKASILASTLCELMCLSRQDLNKLLGQHPSVGDDLKRVARARMKLVESTPHTAFTEHSAQKTLTKLENIDFHRLKNTTEEFIDQRMHIEGMNRKLSLTSGILAEGNHIKVGKEILQNMNRDELNQNNNAQVVAQPPAVVKKGNKQQPIIVQHHNSIKNRAFLTKIQRIVSELKEEDKEVLQAFMLNSIAFHTKRKFEEHCKSLMNQ